MKFLPLTASLMALALFSAPAFAQEEAPAQEQHRLQLKKLRRKFRKKFWSCSMTPVLSASFRSKNSVPAPSRPASSRK